LIDGRNFLKNLFAIAALSAASLLAPGILPAQAGDLHYTANTAPAAASSAPRWIELRIDPAFDLRDRARILKAINEWNYALNGQLRFEVSTAPFDPAIRPATNGAAGGWAIQRVDSRHEVIRAPAYAKALAVTVGYGRNGNVFVVSDRLGRRDLTGIMLHEFGHVLGARHDDHGRLMSPYYVGGKQDCIDRAAAGAVATSQKLAAGAMNWCGNGREPALQQASASAEHGHAHPQAIAR
jgi:hypothetical protein